MPNVIWRQDVSMFCAVLNDLNLLSQFLKDDFMNSLIKNMRAVFMGLLCILGAYSVLNLSACTASNRFNVIKNGVVPADQKLIMVPPGGAGMLGVTKQVLLIGAIEPTRDRRNEATS